MTITDDDGNTETQDITVTVNAVDDPTVVTGGTSGTVSYTHLTLPTNREV